MAGISTRFNERKLLKDVTVTVYVDRTFAHKIAFRLGVQLVRWGCRLAGLGFKTAEIEN